MLKIRGVVLYFIQYCSSFFLNGYYLSKVNCSSVKRLHFMICLLYTFYNHGLYKLYKMKNVNLFTLLKLVTIPKNALTNEKNRTIL